MVRKILSLISMAGLLTGCGLLPDSSSAPTPYPPDYLPTVIYLTAQSIHSTTVAQTAAAATATPASTFTPTPVPPTATDTSTPTPPPGKVLGAIQVNSPGSMSKVISPLEVRMTVMTVKNTKVYITLYNEEGGLLYDQLLNIANASSGEYVFTKLPFEIRAAAEIGILQVTTRDASGVLMALNTVRVLLLSNGVSQINPAGANLYERLTLTTPAFQANITGGSLIVKGNYLPFNTQPLILELVDSDGKSLNTNRVLTFNDLNPQTIDTTIPYKVDAPTRAYLVVRQQDDVLKNAVYLANQQNEILTGPVYVFTQAVTLNP